MNPKRNLFAATLLLISLLSFAARAQPRRPTTTMTPADILRVATVGDPQISPIGDWVVYTVSAIEGDQIVTTLWLVRVGERLSSVPPTSRNPWAPFPSAIW